MSPLTAALATWLVAVATSSVAMETFRIREAVPADIDAVVNVVIAAMPGDPQWKYRFPYRCKYSDDHRKYTRMLYEYFLKPSYEDWQVMVVEVFPEDDSTNSEQMFLGQDATTSRGGKIVSFSVWNNTYVNRRKLGPSYNPNNREFA
jgi:hypothetical protein